MKPSHCFVIVVLAVLATAAIEESRMASLRARLEQIGTTAATKAPAAASDPLAGSSQAAPAAPPTRVRERPTEPAEAGEAEESTSADFAKTVRKMWDNPAGKSMMNQGVKMAVAMMYGDFIDDLGLSKEEADYIRDLLGKGLIDQQEVGMKMMGASPEERTKLAQEIDKRSKENEEAIKAFLNNEEDYRKFTTYKDRLPERQQLDGLRSLMASQQVPLDAASEEKLVEAMHRARTQSGTSDFNGPKGFEEIAKGDVVERFEQDWGRQQEILRKEAGGILDEKEMKAFIEYQEQMKEFQLMGLKMISGKQGQPDK